MNWRLEDCNLSWEEAHIQEQGDDNLYVAFVDGDPGDEGSLESHRTLKAWMLDCMHTL